MERLLQQYLSLEPVKAPKLFVANSLSRFGEPSYQKITGVKFALENIS